MELTRKQREGLDIILERHKNHEPFVVVSGYAGTGKSTLIKFAISALKVSPDRVAYATYTGKAAEVLRKKGNPGACTLHRLLYESVPLPAGGYFHRKKGALGVDIVVVDEVSMVPQPMIDELLSHHVFVIFLGDPFQLPTISKDETNHILDNPHIFLDEIMRQAAESEIIQLTMKIRAGEDIGYFKGNEVQIYHQHELVTGMLTWADQIITATNAKRKALNDQMRQILGYSGLPQDGERMICLHNYWEDFDTNGNPLVNGTTGIIRNPFETFIDIPRFIKTNTRRMPIICGNFETSDGEYLSVDMDKNMILKEEKCIDWRTSYQLGKNKKRIGDIEPREFTYAYAISCHKAQGQEWEKVLVIEERFPFEPLEHARWLYTACTRSSSRLVLIRN